MNNIFRTLIVFGIIFTSCERKFNLNQFGYEEIDAPLIVPPTPDAEAVGKKGVCFTLSSDRFSTKISTLQAHWFYTWGPGLSGEVYDMKPEYTEFVPMQWGKWNINDERVAELKVFRDAGKMHYLLGFNEPDKTDQANMTVDEAIDRWPKLMEVGVPLGSPATTNPLNDWMKEFMQRATEENLRVDFVTVHSYRGASVDNFINMLEDVWNEYGKPIWITEFAVADWTAATPEDNKFSPEQVLNFMKGVLPKLEDLDYVKRYSWFSFKESSSAGTSSALFDSNGELTPLGEYYADFKPNVFIGPGKD
ncbi:MULTISPECIES: glycoside hydrolase family protein [Aestuariivivens]|uniref:glycoside hydrolase family protein n=1 Tax=Aestuariivivens TaxID=1820275 RepID=UPI001F55C81D|nr:MULTISPECIES: glycoside hydrolase family protein [Aestuariivivens]